MQSTLSPLAELEQIVQARATALSLDVDTLEGSERLRALIDAAVVEWSHEHHRGQREISLSDPEGISH
ncbi:MAG: hypothetical protein WD029_03340, partial [Microthrixaceae bacterium]